MRIVKAFAILLIATAIGGSAHASPITYTLTGFLTANLADSQGNVTGVFANTPFVWTLTGDTAQVVTIGTHGGPTTEVPAITDTIALDNTVLVPSIPTFFAVASVPAIPPAGAFAVAGFVDATALAGIAWNSPALYGYNGITGVGPLAVNFDNSGPLPTDGGVFSISGASGLVFVAALPEPPDLSIFLVGLAGLTIIACVRRRGKRGSEQRSSPHPDAASGAAGTVATY
jgi:hypothetical protein